MEASARKILWWAAEARERESDRLASRGEVFEQVRIFCIWCVCVCERERERERERVCKFVCVCAYTCMRAHTRLYIHKYLFYCNLVRRECEIADS